ncbi:MAG: DUF3127 domain-containing protein [Bacteroidales bacterium]|jgi:hypothetical protein|nr:DUF3127 domain-containing protein [Bacteroidales bacterium]
MALELEGTLRQKLGVQSGTSARGPWAKQEFIVEFPDGNFTSQACFTAWGQDKVAELDKYQVGDRVKVSFNLKSREFNGRWYNDLQIWRIAPAGEAQPAAAAPAYAPAAPQAPAPMAPAPTLDDMPADSGPEDDLPF